MSRLWTVGLLLGLASVGDAQQRPLRLVATIPLPGVSGRIDHLSADAAHHRLYVSALGSNEVEVIDLSAGKVIHTLAGMEEPQGVLYAPDSGKVLVANGGDGTLRLFDAASYRPIETLSFSSDADDLRYDGATRSVFLGYGEGAIVRVDAATGRVRGEIRVDGHPEAFAVDGPTVYVNVPTADEIAVLDWPRGKVRARWRLPNDRGNFPMALDRRGHRLFVVCRHPPELLVLDASAGTPVAHVKVVGDADDIYYDAKRKRLYISGGAGAVSVVEQQDPDHYRLLSNQPTSEGARTSLFVPALNRLYVAAPRRGAQAAAIRVFEPE